MSKGVLWCQNEDKTEPADVGGCIPALAGWIGFSQSLSMRVEDDELVAASRFHGRWRRRGLASALLVRGCASEARARLGEAGRAGGQAGACVRVAEQRRRRAHASKRRVGGVLGTGWGGRIVA
jgi:hypothetical protein